MDWERMRTAAEASQSAIGLMPIYDWMNAKFVCNSEFSKWFGFVDYERNAIFLSMFVLQGKWNGKSEWTMENSFLIHAHSARQFFLSHSIRTPAFFDIQWTFELFFFLSIGWIVFTCTEHRHTQRIVIFSTMWRDKHHLVFRYLNEWIFAAPWTVCISEIKEFFICFSLFRFEGIDFHFTSPMMIDGRIRCDTIYR